MPRPLPKPISHVTPQLMTAPSRSCPGCDMPLPEDVSYCPNCGEITPSQRLRRATRDEGEYRRLLQHVLGDGYEVQDMIGRGAFGTVHSARDLALGREVAVKSLLLPTLDMVQRFQREARIVAQLRHPHILPVFFVGASEGLTFMVMPRVRAGDLRTALRRDKRLSIHEAVRIASETAEALDEVHALGVVHRDIKPENILLEGPNHRVQVTDFGVAKVLERPMSGQAIGTIIGTVEYMSPEQCTGDPTIDGRSDVYSLACVVYEMIVGRPPFTATATTPHAVADIFHKHCTEQPKPLRAYGAHIPAPVERAVLRALAKAPDHRFPHASEFGLALREALTRDRPKRWWRLWA